MYSPDVARSDVRLIRECVARTIRHVQADTAAPSRGALMNAKASAGAHVVEAREALARVKPRDAAAYERARVRLAQAKAELDAATMELEAAGS
jgi:hypothetical protein